MAVFNLSSSIDPNKIFLVNRSEIEGRLEAEYYRPEINLLEKKIRSKTSKRLKNFIVKIASGATPSVTEEDKYYSDKQNGIPFLRVQNLQTNGKLYLEDLKYINKKTHETYLKRSQVAAGDLLIKITGVGRMAIASVAPEGFIGNTNQHMVVIKTESRKTSEYLANFLNLDICEKLATRRSTGATRPALDYPALKSIPIIEGIDFSILFKAEQIKHQKEQEAQKILESINAFMLDELNIKLPKTDNSLSSRIYTANISRITGGRFDPIGYTLHKTKIEGGKYPNLILGQIATVVKGQSIIKENTIPGDYPVIAGGQTSPYSHNNFNQNGNVITVSASGAYAGFVWYHKSAIFASDCSVIKSKNEDNVSTIYISEILKLKQKEIYSLQQGAGQPHVYPRDLSKLKIPVPIRREKREEIVRQILSIRSEAIKLQNEANAIVENAKIQIAKNILS